MNVFLIDSPLQLINAGEALYKFELSAKECMLVLVNSTGVESGKQMSDLVSENPWAEVELLDFAKHPKLLRLTLIYRALKKLGKQAKDVEALFLGDYDRAYQRYFARVVSWKRLCVLDDGIATLDLARRRLAGVPDISLGVWKTFERWARRRILRWNDTYLPRINYFTAYRIKALDGEEVTQNDYVHLRDSLKESDTFSGVYFLGEPLWETGFVTNLELEIEYILRIKSYFKGQKFCYLPHRRESTQKLNRIGQIKELTIMNAHMPIELFFASGGPKPSCLGSVGSSAMVPCRAILGDGVAMKIFRLPTVNIRESKRKPMAACYRYFENEGFEVINALGASPG